MSGTGNLNVHAAFGDTNRAGSVPDCLAPAPAAGPVYLEGRLVLSLSFQGAHEDARPIACDGVLERYRLWDDLAEAWLDGGLEVLRFEHADAVVRPGPRPVVVWEGAVDTRARVMPEPDLDEAGMLANLACDLRWRRV